MFRKTKEKEIDYQSLNSILKTGSRIMNIGFFVAIVILILLGTYLLKEWKVFGIIKEILIVISPLFIGFVIAWLFEPFVSKLQKKKLPRIVGCILAYLIIIGAIIIIGYLFIPSLASQIKDFVNVAPNIFEELTDFVVNLINRLNLNDIIDTNELKNNITSFITDYGIQIVSSLPKYVLSIGKSLVSGGANFVLGLMVGFYLLFDFNKVNDNIRKMLPKNWETNYDELTTRINTSLRSYVQGIALVMFLVFVTQAIGLTLAGMEAPIIFALFCAVTDIIPYFGPYIGAIPAIIVGFTISPITGICVLISIIIVQQLENNFYQPLIMGHTMKLHPVTIMLGLLLFGHFFGIIGMILATPVIACVKILLTFINEKLNIWDSEEFRETRKKVKKEETVNKTMKKEEYK